MSMLSISIDLSNSTLAKTVINRICPTPELREKKNRELFDRVVQIEKDLYFHAGSIHLLDRLFLVKSIGDELWYVLDLSMLDELGKAKAVQQVLERLQVIADRERSIFISEVDPSWEEERSDPDYWQKRKHRRMHLPAKIAVELLEDAYNFVIERQKAVSEYYKSMTWEKARGTKVLSPIEYRRQVDEYQAGLAQSIEAVSNALNLGQASVHFHGDKVESIKYTGIRYDPVGRDVDKFFRICKVAVPGLVMTGPNLYKNYLAPDRVIHDTLWKTRWPALRKAVPKRHRKGLNEKIAVYYLPYRHSQNIVTVDWRRSATRSFGRAKRLFLWGGLLRLKPFRNVFEILKYGVAHLHWARDVWHHD